MPGDIQPDLISGIDQGLLSVRRISNDLRRTCIDGRGHKITTAACASWPPEFALG
jgi:hypothetical protein